LIYQIETMPASPAYHPEERLFILVEGYLNGLVLEFFLQANLSVICRFFPLDKSRSESTELLGYHIKQ